MFWQVPNQHISQNISQEHVATDPRRLQLMFGQVPSQHLSQNISQEHISTEHNSLNPQFGPAECAKRLNISLGASDFRHGLKDRPLAWPLTRSLIGAKLPKFADQFVQIEKNRWQIVQIAEVAQTLRLCMFR